MGINWEYKLIRDPIDGFVAVPKELINIIEHPLFQRLRWISQTATGQMVYPGSTHTRFEHSLGVMHLARIAAESIWKFAEENKESLGPFWDDVGKDGHDDFILAAMLVGLLHDVGHAPFSHVYEMAVDYDHEIVGYKMAERILQDSNLREKRFSKWVLEALNKPPQGKDTEELSPVPQILRALIDGPIDIDKGDYLLRDSYHCGVAYGNYGHLRLWNNVGVVQKNDGTFVIGVKEKAAYEAYHMLIARKHMYYAVYEHHTRRKADALLSQILSGSDFTTGFALRMLSSNSVDLSKLLYWNDGFVLSDLFLGSGSSNLPTRLLNDYPRKLIEKFFRRKFPKKEERLSFDSPPLPSDREKRKAQEKEIKKLIRETISNARREGIPLFIYYRKPIVHLPVEVARILIIPEINKSDIKNLAQSLDIEKAVVEEPENAKRIAIEIYTYPGASQGQKERIVDLGSVLKNSIDQLGIRKVESELSEDEQG